MKCIRKKQVLKNKNTYSQFYIENANHGKGVHVIIKKINFANSISWMVDMENILALDLGTQTGWALLNEGRVFSGTRKRGNACQRWGGIGRSLNAGGRKRPVRKAQALDATERVCALGG